MRPVRLRINGFTCFRDEQDIDFSKLDLFAIAGPTGAGKTSILDAMVFALYGEVPRKGAQRLGELISLGLDRASAVLDFEVGAVGYRVVRRMRRQGATQAQIERLQGTAGQPLAEGVRGVEQEVKKLLGIDARTFLKAVVLPQGQFADFLRSEPGQRRGMLRSLLQLDVYERMRERASQLGRDAAQKLMLLRGRLDEDFRDATPERLTAVEQRLRDLATEVRAVAETAELARHKFEALDRQARLRRELDEARVKLQELKTARALIETDEQRAARSERARPLLAILDAAVAARAKHKATLEEVARISPRAQRALSGHRAASERWQAANAAAGEIDALNEARIRLDHVMPLLARRADSQRRVADAEARRARAERELDAGTQQIASCEQQTAAATTEIDDVDRRRQQTGHDPDRLHWLSDALGPAAELDARHRDLTRARGKLAMLDGKLASATADHTAAAQAATRATEAAKAADVRHDGARSALESVRSAHAAHDLRANLAPGDPCPVCLQIAAVIPSIDVPADLEHAAREDRAADRHRVRCSNDAQEARATLQLAEHAVSDAQASRRETAAEIAGIALEVESLAQRLALAVGEISKCEAPALAEEIRRLHADARSRADEHAGLDRTKTELEARLARVRHHHELAQQRAQTAERDRERARSDAAEASTELAAVEAQIRVAVPSGDPEQERRRVTARIDELAKARDEAARAELTARSERDAQSRALAVAEAASATAATELAAADAHAMCALQEAGFPAGQAARTAVLPAKTCDEIARRARTWQSEHAVAAARVGELEPVAGADDVDAATLSAARKDAEAAHARHGQLLAEQGRLGGERTDIETRLRKAAALREQLARSEAEHTVYGQLASDLRTDQLQAYLLEGTFRDIVQGASVRLLELSGGRYALDYVQDDFFVIDHDNARERRRADTLSGGETFLTSLALALQLSEQIQRAAGAVRLDSLFIDEGFGTLDPETLATASDAIQQLGRGHRMVGIITHVQDLTSAMPARIEVVRRADGSRIKVISEA